MSVSERQGSKAIDTQQNNQKGLNTMHNQGKDSGIRHIYGIEIIKDRLQRKRKQYIHQGEKIEQMKCTMQNTGEEIEQLEYVLNEMEHIADVNRAPRVIPNARVEEVFAYLCRVFEFLQHRLKLHFKYKLACEVIFAYYQFKSRLHTPGREYLSFATILTYFKRERGMAYG